MKSKIKKRLIAFMLCMVLVLSSAISAFADDLDTQAQDQTTTMADEPVATSMDDSTDEQQPVAEAEENQEQVVVFVKVKDFSASSELITLLLGSVNSI